MLPALQSTTLEGSVVRLETLGLHHEPDLLKAALDGNLYTTTITVVPGPDTVKDYLNKAKEEYRAGRSLPFVIVVRDHNQVVGTTRFMNIEPLHHRVEIGSTWIAPSWQRTAVNTETKLLMLTHAFEVWGCYRVEFKTDVLNSQSRRAIERLGAKEEGVLRRHMIMPDGRVRDSVYYSIVDHEWLAVKHNLLTQRSRFSGF